MLSLNNRVKKLAKAEYDSEYEKQTDAYAYYLKSDELKNVIKDNEQINEGEHENVPFICMGENIALISEDDSYKVYECGEYFIYESKKGHSSEEEKRKLVTIAEKLNADLIYSDVDNIACDGKTSYPFYKPCYSVDTAKCFDYFTDFYAVKKSKSKVDIMLLEKISHVTEVLFHYDFNDNNDYLEKAYSINNSSYLTDDFYIDNGEFDGIKDEISVIIPSKDNPDLISVCLNGLLEAKVKSGINTIQVVIVDNGSTDIHQKEITSVINAIKSTDSSFLVDYIYSPSEFNFSAMCNKGAKEATGKYLLFMNDDIEITDSLFLLKFLYFAKMDHVGAVGCKLLYPGEERRIQHVGITNLKFPGPSHKLSTFPDTKTLYFGRNRGVHNCLAVTAACLMVSAEKFFKVSGFYDKMKVGYNDVDLCVCLYENGLLNLVNNECVLIHHESISRGSDSKSEEKMKRLDSERELLYERHPWLLEKGDPYYNPNLAEDFLDYRVNVIPEFERRDYVSSDADSLREAAKRCEAKYKEQTKGLYFSIDSFTRNRGYYEITGWALINKKENYLYDTYLVVPNKNGELTVFSTAKMLRTDIKDVFAEAKYVDLSGFFARIPADLLADTKRPSVLVINKQTGKRYYARLTDADI